MAATKTKSRGPSAPAGVKTKLLINNEWVDPVEGETFDTFNPATGEVDRQGRRGRPRRRRPGRQGRPQGARDAAPGAGWTPPTAAGCSSSSPTSIEKNAEELAALESLNCGKTITRLARRHGRRRQHAALLRRLGRQDRGPHRPRARQLPLLHAAAAGRRRRPDHPLELPAADAGLEVGPGPGLRQHRRHEAGRADAADRPARGRAGRSRPASRRASSTSSTASARRPAHAMVVHPDVDKIAFTGHVDTAKIIQKNAADTLKRTTFELGGKSPNVIFADCRPGRRRSPAPSTPSTSTAASAARPAAGCSSRRRSTRSSSSAWPRRPRSASSATRSTRAPSRARRCRRSRWTRSSATSSWARSRARSW